MALPRAERVNGREVHIHMAARGVAPAYTDDVEAEVPVAEVGDAGAAGAVLDNPENTRDAVEPPHGDGDLDPRVKALACGEKSQCSAVPAPDQQHDDMRQQE